VAAAAAAAAVLGSSVTIFTQEVICTESANGSFTQRLAESHLGTTAAGNPRVLSVLLPSTDRLHAGSCAVSMPIDCTVSELLAISQPPPCELLTCAGTRKDRAARYDVAVGHMVASAGIA
jgi:hypothetical protein